jgi:hypothetical protein
MASKLSSPAAAPAKETASPPKPSASTQDPPDTKLNKRQTNVELLLKRIRDMTKEQREAHNMKVYGTKGKWLNDTSEICCGVLKYGCRCT